ncbi:MAG: hypothetical protein V1793_18335 [Pseudomonadota bacterium]
MNDFLQSLRGGQKDKRNPKTRRGFDNTNHFNSTSHYQQPPYQNVRSGNLKRGTRIAQQPPLDDPMPIVDTDIMDSLRTLTEAIVKNQEILTETYERRVVAEERKASALEDIADYLRALASQSSQDEGNDFNEDDQAFVSMPEDPEPYPETRNMAPDYAEPMEEEPVRTKPVRRYVKSKPAADTPKHHKVVKEPVKVLKRTRAQKLEALGQAGNEGIAAKPVKTVTPKTDQPGILPREEVMNIIQTMRDQGATFDEVAQHFKSLGQPTFSGRGEWHAQTVHRLCNKR